MKHYAMTGGATGIGAAIKQLLLGQGHSVVVVDLRDADIEADLSNSEGRAAAVDALQQQCAAGLDGFIACAGVASHVPDHRIIAAVNYFGTTELVNGVKDLVARNKGKILLVSSNSAPMPTEQGFIDRLLDEDHDGALKQAESMEGHQVYSGTKQAIARWMRRNIGDFASRGININAIAPGYTQTPMTEQVENDPNYGPAIKEFMATIPIGRPGKPEDMAAAADFLLSDAAGFVCGSVLFIDGGHDALHRPDHI